MENNTYQLECECYNCEYKGTVVIEKGVTVKDKECPTCGNRTLSRYYPPVAMSSEDYT